MEKNRKLNVLDLVKDPLNIWHREDFRLLENDAISLSMWLEGDCFSAKGRIAKTLIFLQGIEI